MLEKWNIGMMWWCDNVIMEYWKDGILERWNAGILERWNIGKMEYWKDGILEWWNIGMMCWWNAFPPSTSLEKEVDAFFDRVCKPCKLCKLQNDKPYIKEGEKGRKGEGVKMRRLGGCENFPPSTSLEKEVDVFLIVLCKLRNDKSYLSSKIVMFLRRIDLKNI